MSFNTSPLFELGMGSNQKEGGGGGIGHSRTRIREMAGVVSA